MHIFHKWKGVPMYGGDITKTKNRTPTKDDYGYLRRCKKCGQKSSKNWVTIKIPFFKILEPCSAHTFQGHRVYTSMYKTLIITTKTVKLFQKWMNV